MLAHLKENWELERIRAMVHSDQRAFVRNEVEAPLQFKIPEKEALAVTRLYNVGQGGVYFVSHLQMMRDHETTIVIPDLLAGSPTPEALAEYRVRIRWCNQIKKQKAIQYGVGAQFLEKTDELAEALAMERQPGCELCGRVLKGGSICRINGTVCLCLPCYKHLEKIPGGSIRESILRFIDGNVI